MSDIETVQESSGEIIACVAKLNEQHGCDPDGSIRLAILHANKRLTHLNERSLERLGKFGWLRKALHAFTDKPHDKYTETRMGATTMNDGIKVYRDANLVNTPDHPNVGYEGERWDCGVCDDGDEHKAEAIIELGAGSVERVCFGALVKLRDAIGVALRDEPKQMTGFIFTDARMHVACSLCGAQPREKCTTPRGREATYPHMDRVKTFQTQYPDAGRIERADVP